jgi:hypothetical protein
VQNGQHRPAGQALEQVVDAGYDINADRKTALPSAVDFFIYGANLLATNPPHA